MLIKSILPKYFEKDCVYDPQQFNKLWDWDCSSKAFNFYKSLIF